MKTGMTMSRLALLLGLCVGGAVGALAAPPVTGGLKLWLDASDVSSLVTNATGNVSQWTDLSGGGHHATQSVSSAQAIYNPTGLNARAVLVFDGGDYMKTAPFICFSNHTIFVVAQTVTTNESDILGSGTIAAGDVLLMHQAGKYRGHYWTSNSVITTIDSATLYVLTPAIYGQRLDDAALRIYRNGQLDATGSATVPHTDLVKPVSLGSRYLDSSRSFKGGISEVLIYDRALSDAERLQVEEYLAVKWLPPITKPGAPPVTGGLKLWLDASDITSLVTNGSGKVSQWNNQAVLWRHAAQSVASPQPTYKADGLNGHPSLSFNGGHFLSTPTFLNYSNHAVFVVAQATITNQNRDILGSGGTTPGNILLMNVVSGIFRGHYWPTASLYSLDSTIPSVTRPVIYEQTVDDTTMQIRRNGKLDGSKTITGVRTNAVKAVFLGSRDGSSALFAGEMSEVLVYDRALSSNECVQVETYLYAKWLVPRKGTLIRVW